MKELFSLFVPLALIAVYFVVIVSVVAFKRARRKSRWPFQSGDRLLRGPGETLKRRIVEIDEGFAGEMFVGISVGLGALAITNYALTHWAQWTPVNGAWFGLSCLLAVYGVAGWRFARIWQRRQNNVLGWFGERYVAEWLEPAKLQGWRVFHDVPFENNGAKFNIDHVVVGAGGVFAIETKTRRKGRPRPGFKDNEAFFDGSSLVWPWGEDNHGLDQAERNSRWLAEWIRKETNEKLNVTPLLVLPGWFLQNKPSTDSRPCSVLNAKWLPDYFAKQRPVLTEAQFDFVSSKLDTQCRDVEA